MSNSQPEGRNTVMGRARRLAAAGGIAAAVSAAALTLPLSGAVGATASATKTFDFTGGEQVFSVPDGVTSLDVVAVGGKGAAGAGGGTATGGSGASAKGTIPVTPGQILFIEVGGNSSGRIGGFNGAGSGGDDTGGVPGNDGGGGGGATDIRTISRAGAGNTLNSRLIIAGGGGGGGGDILFGGAAGGDGGSAGQNANGSGGNGANGGGTAGGTGGPGATRTGPGSLGSFSGSLGQGGNGGASAPDVTGGGGGGGGAGKYGGAGAGNGSGGDSSGGAGGAGSTDFAAIAEKTSNSVDSTGTPLVRLTYGSGGGSGLKFGKVKRNKRRGTAKLPVIVPGSGTLSLAGKGIVKKRNGRSERVSFRLTREIPKAGTYQLKIKSKGNKKEKLFDTGKVRVRAVVTFAPSSGDPVTASKRVKLKKN